MEIAEAAISSILSQTETHLSSTSMPPQLLTEIYHKFLADNHVTNHTPLPILQTKLQALEMITPPTSNPSSSITEKMPKLNKKRKQKEVHPKGEKKSKYFLSQGPYPPPKPP